MLSQEGPHRVVTSPYLRYGRGLVWDTFADRLWTDPEIPGADPERVSSLLDRCRNPAAVDELRRDLEVGPWLDTLLAPLLARSWLLEPEGVWRRYHVRHLEIEATAHCNWRCRCCPVAYDPKPRATMPMELFERIIDEAVGLGTVVDVTLNSYNEPTLDPFFTARAETLARAGLGLRLHTNGSGLTDRKLEVLAGLGNTKVIVFNFPTVDPERFATLTGAGTYRQSRRALDRALELGLPVRFSVNGTAEEQSENLPAIRAAYGSAVADIEAWPTGNRVGLLSGYGEETPVSDPLSGCHLVVDWVHFSVTGDLFICCEDYYQKGVYGNIRDDSLRNLLESPAAQSMRRKVFGAEDSPQDYICRRCDTMRARQEKERELFGDPHHG